MKKSSFYRLIAVLIVLIIIVGAVLATAIGSDWYTKKDVRTWFDNWGKGTPAAEPTDSKDDETNNGDISNMLYVPETTKGNGVMLTSAVMPISADVTPKTSYLLKVVLEPAESQVTDFSWKMTFKNPSSEWATGKSVDDYIQGKVTGNNLQYEVTCKQTFSEPVNVTVTYDYNPDINATVELNYIKRLESVKVKGFDATKFGTGTSSNLSLEGVYGEGTVQGNLTITQSYGEIDTTYFNEITGQGIAGRLYAQAEGIQDTEDNSLQLYDDSSRKPSNSSSLILDIDKFLAHDITSAAMEYLKGAFVQAAKSETPSVRAVVKYTYSYSSKYSASGIAYSLYDDSSEIDTSISYFKNKYTDISSVKIEGDSNLYF